MAQQDLARLEVEADIAAARFKLAQLEHQRDVLPPVPIATKPSSNPVGWMVALVFVCGLAWTYVQEHQPHKPVSYAGAALFAAE